MSRVLRMLAAVALSALVVCHPSARAADPDVPLVDPAELANHPEWVGREVAVDARVRFFKTSDQGHHAELVLKRGNVLFRLPPRLRPDRGGDIHVVRVSGVLRRDGNEWYCDVTSMTPLPRDLDRLEQAVAALPRTDYERRAAWGRWAQRRADEYNEAGDKELRDRGRAVEAQAFQIEADQADAPDRPALWLKLARRIRERKLPAEQAAALAHRAFRARLKEAKTAGDLDALREQILEFFPDARTPSRADLSAWLNRYEADPAQGYRDAPPDVRAGLDRRLLADVLEGSLQLQIAGKAEDSAALLALAEQAKLQLPDRPELGKRLEEQGLEAAARHPEALRESEIKRFAQAFEDLGKPDRAAALRRAWLDQQRRSLSATDAEGRLILARQYESLLHDETAAVELIKDALRIDKRYAEAEKALKAHGYRKVNDEWVRSSANRPDRDREADGPASDQSADGSLRGLTPQQVKARMGGKPDQVIRLATQGQVVEQWVYRTPGGTKYVRIVRRPDMAQAVVEADVTMR